jgi:hypothetical protein
LRANGLGPQLTKEFSGSYKQQKLLEELWMHLGSDDEGGTPYGGDVHK